MRPMIEVTRIGFALLVLLVVSFSGAGADCYIDSTAGYVGFWRAWEPSWCGEGLEDTVVAAFNYWGIGDAAGELVIHAEDYLTDSPEIKLSDLKEELYRKRVALFSTHGGDPLYGSPGMAVEYYATPGAADSARESYLDGGYLSNELISGKIPSETAWALTITDAGISSHLSNQLWSLDAMIYGDYCYSKATKDAWSVATFVGYEYNLYPYISCHNLHRVWTRLACGAYPWHGHQIDDALRYLSEIHCWGVNQKNQLDCTRNCKDMDPAARLGSHWAYLEGDEVIVGWHAEAELDTREYRIEAGDGQAWEPVAVVMEGETIAPEVYTVAVRSGYEYYRVVEVDRYGDRCEFHPMPVAPAPPWYLADLMESAGSIDEVVVKPKTRVVSCASAGSRLEDSPGEVPDWVFYGPDSLLVECGPAISWFEWEGLSVDTVWAASPDY